MTGIIWGVNGHNGAVSLIAHVPWVELAVQHEGWVADALLEARWLMHDVGCLVANYTGSNALPNHHFQLSKKLGIRSSGHNANNAHFTKLLYYLNLIQ